MQALEIEYLCCELPLCHIVVGTKMFTDETVGKVGDSSRRQVKSRCGDQTPCVKVSIKAVDG